jgi:hypothetical protein
VREACFLSSIYQGDEGGREKGNTRFFGDSSYIKAHGTISHHEFYFVVAKR